MRRLEIAAGILTADGMLLLLAAVIHLLIAPRLRAGMIRGLSPQAARFIGPPFMLNHLVVGVLLLAVGLSTIYSATGLRQGHRWAWVIATINALAVLVLPVILVVSMPAEYFRATPFLIAAICVTAAALSMLVPLLVVRSDLKS